MPCARELFIVFILSAIFIFILSRSLLSCLTRHRSERPSETSNTFSTLNSITAFLNPPRTSLKQLLQERAGANHRLLRVLNLTNTFVDADPSVHARFVQHSHSLLKNAHSSGWARFQETCSQAVDLSLNEYPSLIISDIDSLEDIPFDHFIQIVVLRTILAGLLNIGKDVDELDIRSLASVTTIINQLWTYSKSANASKETSLSSSSSALSERLQSHLRDLVPPESGLSNPIDFVVPTWETLWRVCATLIARIQEDESYEGLFRELLHAETPMNRQFNTPVSPYGFSVRDFVVESMRLHPPVKRISRIRNSATNEVTSDFSYHHTVFPSSPVPTTRAVADIEKVLRDPEIWSDDALSFNPRRHRGPSTVGVHEQIRAETLKLVFGHGPLRCVAASWAPMAAAVIGATVVTQLREAGFEVVLGERIGGRVGWGGWKIRRRLG